MFDIQFIFVDDSYITMNDKMTTTKNFLNTKISENGVYLIYQRNIGVLS